MDPASTREKRRGGAMLHPVEGVRSLTVPSGSRQKRERREAGCGGAPVPPPLDIRAGIAY